MRDIHEDNVKPEESKDERSWNLKVMDMNEDEVELESECLEHHVSDCTTTKPQPQTMRYPLNQLHKTLHSKFNHWLIAPPPKPPDTGKFSSLNLYLLLTTKCITSIQYSEMYLFPMPLTVLQLFDEMPKCQNSCLECYQ